MSGEQKLKCWPLATQEVLKNDLLPPESKVTRLAYLFPKSPDV